MTTTYPSPATPTTVSSTVNNDGDTITRGSDSFLYDEANRLVSATVSGTTTTYTYDGDGDRTSSTVTVSGTPTTTSYVYDVNSSLPVVLTDSTGTSGHQYVYGAQGLAYITDQSGTLLGVVHTDGLGSVRALTNSSGSVIQTYATDEWGVPTQTQGTLSQPFSYTGALVDSTGLVDLRARVYDPTSGRFLQRDGFSGVQEEPLSLNRYAYTENNPASLVDLSGFDPSNKVFNNGNDQGSPSVCSPIPLPPFLAALQVLLTQSNCSIQTEEAPLVSGETAGSPEWCGPLGLGAWLPAGCISLAKPGNPNAGKTVREILKGKKGSITRAPLPPQSPSWSDVLDSTWEEIVEGAKKRLPGYDTIRKLLSDSRFYK